MNAKMYAILTIIVIGLVSFLIGKLLTSTRWKKKFFDSNLQKKILENKTKKQKGLLTRSKEELKIAKQRLDQSQSGLEKLEKEVSLLHQRNTSLKNKSTNSSYSDEAYNRLLNDLNAEKKKNAILKADMKRVVGNKVPATTVIKKDKETRNNNGHEVKLNNKVPIKAPKVKKNGLEGSLLFPIIKRVSIFSNLEQKDDLTLIDGIDEALAVRLNEVGFINFKQIAMLTQKDLNTISLEMQMSKDQAMNDNWVAQARNLYHKKYSS